MVVLTDPGPGSGTSVTNACETIATELFYDRLSHIPFGDIRWIEHYPHEGSEWEETFDEIFLTWDGSRFKKPQWKPLDKETVGRIKEEVKL